MGNSRASGQPPAAPADRMYRVIRVACPIGTLAHIGFIPMFATLAIRPMVLFNVASVVMWLAAYRANERSHQRLALGLIATEMVAHACLAVYLLGWGSGFGYYLIPLIALILFDDRLPAPFALAASGAIGVLMIAMRALGVENPPLDQHTLELLNYPNLAIPLLGLGVISYYYRLASQDAEGRMRELAATDALTDLPNRRSMIEKLREEEARVRRGGPPFSVIVIDIDHFKDVNDAWGHELGDEVLRSVAALLRRPLRVQDVVARWGGEEFLILLPGTETEAARWVAEKLREVMAEQVLFAAGHDVRVTLTAGVSGFGATDSADACIQRADAALYQGKRAGRNRVEIGSPAA